MRAISSSDSCPPILGGADQALSKIDVLQDRWVLRDGHVYGDGDAPAVDALIANDLAEVASIDGGWRKRYRDRTTGRFWDLSYPEGEPHGGGPRRLQELSISAVDEWRQATLPTRPSSLYRISRGLWNT